MIQNFKISLGFILMLLLAACSSTRHLPFESYSLEPETPKTLLQKIAQTESAQKYLQISRFTAEYSGMQEQNNFKGYVRIAQDSMLMLSLAPVVGSELMRMVLSPDSALLINRFDYTYSRRPYEASQQMIPLPYPLLEALLSYHFSDQLRHNFSLSIQEGMYLLESANDRGHYSSYAVDANYLVRKFYYKDFVSNTTVDVQYLSFLELDEQLFPQDIEVKVRRGAQVAILRLKVKKVESKTHLSFPFSVSSRYTLVE